MINNFVSTNTSDEISKFIENNKFKKFFLLTGKKSFFLSGANILFKEVLKKKENKVYFKESFYPEINELKKIFFTVKKYKPDLIIAVGEGSVIDYSKIINCIDNVDDIEKKIIQSNCKLKKSKSSLLIIPTTAGSGAEVTSSAVIYVKKKKYSVEGKLIKPKYFFLIPNLILKANKKIKASSGFDAIAQSLESIISKKSNQLSLTYAKKSLQLSLKYYLDFLKKPNKDNSYAMALAANLSGKAINISKTTAPHAVSYPFTSLYGISHGHAVSLTLEKFFYFNFVNSNKSNANFDLNQRFKMIFNLSNVANINDFTSFILNIKKNLKLESNYKNLGVDIDQNLSRIISSISIQRLSNNPIELNKNDLKYILLSK